MSKSERQRGQATVITVLFMTVLIAMAAAVLDVGSWYRADRALQATVDAAALAGAQALPEDEAEAKSLAFQYAEKNGGEVDVSDIVISTTNFPRDTITVDAEAPAPGFFARIFGISSVTVAARAKARAGGVSEARYVAPITVRWDHEKLIGCLPEPVCAGPEHPTTLDLLNLHNPGNADAAGSFGLIDLRAEGDGNPGANVLADWMEKGFNQYMGKDVYYDAAPSANYNNGQFKSALGLRKGTPVLFPIYLTLTGSGTNAQFFVIGWVAFVPTGFTGGGSNGSVTGYFKEVIWDGIQASTAPPTFGVKSVELVE
jgi:hypothetical protein